MSERLSDDDYRAWIDAGSPNALEAWAIIVALRAEREKLEARIEGLEIVARGVNAMGVEIRALRALLTEVPRWLMNLTPRPLRRRIDEAIAQPAESGATK